MKVSNGGERILDIYSIIEMLVNNRKIENQFRE